MRVPARRWVILLTAALVCPWQANVGAELAVHPLNPRWLTDDGGDSALVLTGAHAWGLFQDYDFSPLFDATDYLDGLAADGHNFTRGWFWEDGYYSPLPYVKKDGLYRLSPPYRRSYVRRLRKRLRAARSRGLYTSVMLFQGWSMDDRGGLRDPDPWHLNPYNRNNTDERVTKQRGALHVGAAQPQQLEYLSELAGRLCSAPNLIWELANEPVPESLGAAGASNWQRNILGRLRLICPHRLVWASCPLRTGLSPAQKRDLNRALYSLAVHLVSPCDPLGRHISDPPGADGRKVVIADSDHLGQVSFEWAWKAFLRGQHPAFMDLTQTLTWWNGPPWDPDDPEWPRVRRALGAIQELVAAVNRQRSGRPAGGLAEMVPQTRAGRGPGDLTHPASSRWALFSADRPCPRTRGGAPCRPTGANGDELLVYAEPSETLEICSLAPRSAYRYRWKRARGSGFHAQPQSDTTGRLGCLRLRNPSASVSILHLERKLASVDPLRPRVGFGK